MKAFLKKFCMALGIGLCLSGILYGHFFEEKQEKTASPQTVREENRKNPEESTEAEHSDSRTSPKQKTPEKEASAEESPGKESLEEEPPEEKISGEEASLEQAPVVLAFAGDVLFSEQYLAAYDQNGISAIADAEMLSEMQEADLFLLNEEFPFSLRGEAMEDKQYTFRADPKYIKIFQELGTDIVTIANNHSLDFGQDAFCDTLDTIRQTDIACIGGGYNIAEASAPAIRTIRGQTFAVFGATRVSPSYEWYATGSQPGLFQTYDPAKLNAAITEAKQTCDYAIVFVHWGIEHNEFPEEYQRQLAKGYIDAGADLVVGCHPHILQGFEYYSGVPIVYSLGNYLFGNRSGETLLLKASFSEGVSPEIQLIPCQRTNGILARIRQPAGLYQHLTDISFGTGISDEGILTP